MKTNSRRTGLVLIMAAFTALSAGYNVLVPSFEAPDEPAHVHYIAFVVKNKNLPRQYPLPPDVPAEGHQPPLYYALMAPAAHRLNVPDALLTEIRRLDWVDVTVGRWHLLATQNESSSFLLLDPAGPARFVHDGHERWPFAGWRRSVHILRLFATLFGLIVIAATYYLAMVVFRSVGHALIAAAFLAFIPQFVFISSTVSNDSLANAVAALFYALWARWWQSGLSRRRAVIVGCLCGLGLLTKTTLLFLVPMALIGCLMVKGSGQKAGRNAALVVIAALAVAGPWFLRNQQLYGDPLATQMQLDTLPRLVSHKTLASDYFFKAFPVQVSQSFYAVFGWMNVPGWQPAQRAFLGVATAMGLGCFLGVVRKRTGKSPRGQKGKGELLLLWLLLAAVLAGAQLVLYNLSYDQPQGRLLFVALPPIVVLGVYGLRHIVSLHRAWRAAPPIIAVMGALIALFELLHTIPIAYRGASLLAP